MSNSAGISSFEIERINKNNINNDLINNFVGIFPFDKMKFIDFHSLMKKISNAKYPFFYFEYRQSWNYRNKLVEDI